MSTAETVKAQLQADIVAANEVTGKQDATMHDAVASLIEGFGQGGEVLPEAAGLSQFVDGVTYATNGADLTTVADAIREKAGTEEPLAFPGGWKEAVEGIVAGTSGIYMAKVTPASATDNLTISHNLGTTDILLACCWAETLGGITLTVNHTLGKFWTKTDIPNQRDAVGNDTSAMYITQNAYTVFSAPTVSLYWDTVVDENTFQFTRQSAASTFAAGVTYTVIIIAANVFSGN